MRRIASFAKRMGRTADAIGQRMDPLSVTIASLLLAECTSLLDVIGVAIIVE